LTDFSQRLLDWYERSARNLPWRGSQDAYAIWVSEVMLQQTRVETVIPYYRRWMEHFTSLLILAEAPEQEVLRYWEGLGYYSRARNLHHAARRVVAEYGGVIPADRRALESLPGVGKYTAGAIASIAFGLDEAALDGNIRRVLARVFNVEIPARSPEGERLLWSLARENLPAGKASDYNQAIMDLGATVCLPHNPICLFCPLAELCQAHAFGVEEQRPVMMVKPAVPKYVVTAAVIRRDGQVLIARRPENGLLGGMWEFPGGKVENGESLEACLFREIEEELGAQVAVGADLGVYRHAYTHFKVILHAFECHLSSGEPRALHASEIRWVLPEQFGDFPMGKIDRQIARKLQEVETRD
jgi:A/G-specific adenine glycosylase